MKRMMFLFVLALCMAGCTAQTRIERVQMPAAPVESIAIEDARPKGRKYTQMRSPVPARSGPSARRWSWGRMM